MLTGLVLWNLLLLKKAPSDIVFCKVVLKSIISLALCGETQTVSFPPRRVFFPINCSLYLRAACVHVIEYAKGKFRTNCALENDLQKDSAALPSVSSYYFLFEEINLVTWYIRFSISLLARVFSRFPPSWKYRSVTTFKSIWSFIKVYCGLYQIIYR